MIITESLWFLDIQKDGTVMLWASQSKVDGIEKVKFLLENSVNINIPNKVSSIFRALVNCRVDCVKLYTKGCREFRVFKSQSGYSSPMFVY